MKTSEHGSAPSHNTKPNGWGIRIHPPPPQTKGCLQTEELRTRQLYLTKKKCYRWNMKRGRECLEGRGSWTSSAVKLISQTRGWKASLLGGSSHPGVDGVSLSYHMCFSHFSVILTLWWTTAQMVRICSNYEG